MESILVLTHVDETGSALTKASLEAVTAGLELAARLSAPLAIGIIAADVTNLSKGLPSAKLLAVSGEAFAQPRYSTDAAACVALSRAAAATIVLAPTSARFSRIAAGVAYRLGGFIDTHITAICGTTTVEATRWFYRQRVEAVVTRDPRHRQRHPRSHAGRANHPPRRQNALCHRRWMDQETARRPNSHRRSQRSDSRLPAPDRRIPRQQQIPCRSGRRWTASPPLSHPHEPGRPDRSHAPSPQGPRNLLPR